MRVWGLRLAGLVLFYMVEAEGEDLDDDLKEDFGPGLFFRFSFHIIQFLCRMVSGVMEEKFYAASVISIWTDSSS